MTSSNYLVREGSLEDAYRLAPFVKQADLDEVWASSRKTSLEALLAGFNPGAKTWSLVRRNTVVLMFGVNSASISSPVGVPWLLGRELEPCEGLAVLKRSRQYVREMRQSYSFLENWTDFRHKESHAWLRWCGFNLEEPKPWGVEGLPFQRFWMPGYV